MNNPKHKHSNKQDRQYVEQWKDFSSYVSKYRYNSYWHQLDETLKSQPKTVLEIGVGSSVTSSYLKHLGIDVVTLDIEHELNPTICGSVSDLPFADNSIDTVVCCQVLEHLPFELFKKCLSELHRVCKNTLVLSLPDKTPGISIILRMPNFLFKDFSFYIPWAIREPIKEVKEHHWEIGRRGYPAKRIKECIGQLPFNLETSYRVPEYPYHHFFIAKTKNSALDNNP